MLKFFQKLKKVGKFNLQKVKLNISVQQIALAGLMLGLITIFKIIDKFMPKSPVGAAWIEIYMIFAVIMVLMLPFIVSSLVLIAAPFLWLIIGSTWQANPLSFIFDYSLPLASVLLIHLARFFSLKKINFKLVKISYREIAIVFFTIQAFVIKFYFHTISGVLSYQMEFLPSAILNAPFTFATMGITILFVLCFLSKIDQLQNLVNQSGMKW